VKTKSVEVTIERILPGGVGLAHADGRTVMVPLAAPGDRLRIHVDRTKGNVDFASIEQIIEPSPLRVEPPCPYFGRCGGCDFQQLNYQAQLDAKVEIIRDCLRRIGGIENPPDFQVTPAPNQWHYRSRAQWQYDSIPKRLGYFEAGSRRVCDVVECAVLAPELQQTLSGLRERMRDGLLPEDARDFRALASDEGVSLAPPIRDDSETVKPDPIDRGLSSTVRKGPHSHAGDIRRTIHGETYHLNAESFFQTNADLLPQLIDAALGESRGETAIELYCGVGLFTLPLTRRFKQLIGVESSEAAAGFARVNLANAGLANAKIANEDVADWLENLECAGNDGALDRGRKNQRESGLQESHQVQSGTAAAALQSPDFLLLDPPRTGAESRVINGIIKLRSKRICYVSCDPATLARDLKKLTAGGYTLCSLVAFDMFPQTHHVETVVHLSV
jgi:23S rRNA (uracil1939-C5)-methyltransferase